MSASEFPVLSDSHAGLSETLDILRERDRTSRRRLLRTLGGVAAAAVVLPSSAGACSLIPSETAGPYPGDGTNGPNALTQSGILRSDIRASFGSAGTAVAAGTPLTVTLRLVSTVSGCAPLQGLAVYVWHCDASGGYSMYSSGVTGQNYLRGVQVSDVNGEVSFTTIFPGCYAGRWPHMHFEIFASAAQAVSGRNALRTSQLALPEATCREVYAQSALYPNSTRNLDGVPLSSDNVFRDDGAALQMATVTGSVGAGYRASLEVGISVAATAIAPDVDQHGLTGTWYQAATSGQGFSLVVYPGSDTGGQGLISGGWFTYDIAPSGGVEKQRWYTFSGPLQAGRSSATVPIYRNIGGNFNAAPVTQAQEVGSMTLAFSSCTAGEVSYAFTDGSGRAGVIPITRLTDNVTCRTTDERPGNADFALSGNWYSPDTSGQGFIFELNAVTAALAFCWYTYAVNGQAAGVAGQRWYTGQGPFQAGSRQVDLTLYESQGGVFDTAPGAGQSTTAVGSAVLRFVSCTEAQLSFAFSSGANAGQSGQVRVYRLGPSPAACSG